MKLAIAAAALLAGSTLAAIAAPMSPAAIQGMTTSIGASDDDAVATEVHGRRGHWDRGRHMGWYKMKRGRHMRWRGRNWR